MKQLCLLITAILMSTCGFAGKFNINASPLKDLSSAWNSNRTISSETQKNDITMVYGGKDISLRPTLNPNTTTA